MIECNQVSNCFARVCEQCELLCKHYCVKIQCLQLMSTHATLHVHKHTGFRLIIFYTVVYGGLFLYVSVLPLRVFACACACVRECVYSCGDT